MSAKLFAVAAGALLAAVCLVPAHAEEPDMTGIWLSQNGRTKVKVVECGHALCGRIVWLKEPIDRRTGKPRTDRLNPDPDMRDRPMLGLRVVLGLRPVGAGRWSGPIYHADEGMMVQVSLTAVSENIATMRGCIAILCKTERWTRVG